MEVAVMVPELHLFHPSDLEEARIATAREREFWALMLGPPLEHEGVPRHRAVRSSRVESRPAGIEAPLV